MRASLTVLSSIFTAFTAQASVAGPVRASVQLTPCLEYKTPTRSGFPAWKDDVHYELMRAKSGRAFKLRIVGDVLDINPTTLPSFVRDVDQAASTIAEVVPDAREIHLRALPFALASSGLRPSKHSRSQRMTGTP